MIAPASNADWALLIATLSVVAASAAFGYRWALADPESSEIGRLATQEPERSSRAA